MTLRLYRRELADRTIAEVHLELQSLTLTVAVRRGGETLSSTELALPARLKPGTPEISEHAQDLALDALRKAGR